MARLNWARLFSRAGLAAILALSGGVTLGQTPSAAQMEAFRNLTPEQQQAIMEQMGGSGQAGSVRRDRDLASPETVKPRPTSEGATDPTDEREVDGAWPGSMTALPQEPRIRASDTVLIEAKTRPVDAAAGMQRSAADTKRLQAVLDRVLRGNPYKLDLSGVLRLPGVAPIPLAGLTESQASERLNPGSALAAFEAKLQLPPLEKMDVDALRPFGYDRFAGVPSTFAPVSDIPLLSEHVVGPGDRFEVQLIGNTKSRQSLVVNRDGRIMFPELGPIAVAGLKFDAAKARIEARVREQMIGTQAELARYEVRDGETRRTDVIKVDLARALAGDSASDIPLAPFDLLVVKRVSEWAEQEIVIVEGEVRFPGEYPIQRGETMGSLIERAGGLTSMAYAQGSICTREYLKERGRQQLRVLTDRMRQDLGSLALQSAQTSGPMASQASDTLSIGQSLLADLQATEPVGRLVIDLDKALAAQSSAVGDIVLRGGDRLRISKTPQEVTVMGEVQNSTSQLFIPSLTRDDYLAMSGGLSRRADDKRIYVVRANGSVDAGGGSR